MTQQGQHFTLGGHRAKGLWAPVLAVALFGTMALGGATPARAADPFAPSVDAIPAATPNIELTGLTISGGSIERPADFAGSRTVYWVMPDVANGGTVAVVPSAPSGATISYTLDGTAQASGVFNLSLSASKLMSEIGITVTDGTRTNHYYLDVSSQDPSSYPVVEQYYPNMKPYNPTTDKTLVLTDQFQEDSSVVNPGVLDFIAQYLEGSQKNPSIITGPVLAKNPAWHSLHYHLAIWNNPTASIIWDDDWTTKEWDQLADLFDTDPGIFIYAQAKDTGNIEPVFDSVWSSYLMNITNENYYQWMLAAIIDQCRSNNYDSVFLDSYNMDTVYAFTNYNFVNYDGTALASYQDPQLGGLTWAQASEEFMARMTRDLNRAGIWSLPNIGNQRTTWDPIDYAYSNGGMFEQAIDTPTVAGGDWQQDMSRYIYLSNKDKVLIFQAYGTPDINAVTTRLYKTAAYQLCRGNYTYMNEVVEGQSQASWYPEYDIGAMLGAPTETATTPDVFSRAVDQTISQYQIGSSLLFQRHFQNGLVVVNGDPSGTAHDFTVPSGPSYESVTIQPGSGGTVTDAGIGAITGAANYPLIKTPVTAGQTISIPGDGAVILVTTTPAPVLVTSIILNPMPGALVAGTTASVTATVFPSNATNKALTWTSSNPTVATVDQSGVVTAVSPGPATITATAQDGSGKSATITITVAAASIPIESITLIPPTLSMIRGTTTMVTALIYPPNATNQSLAWATMNGMIAIVDQYGFVTAVGPGTTDITATAQDGTGWIGMMTVTVSLPVPVTSVTVTPPTAALTVGDTTALTATVAPTDATNQSVAWSSSDSTVATVDQTGKVTAVGPGPATITATSQDGSNKTGASTITVAAAPVPVATVTVAPATVALTVGDTTTLTATVAPSTATDKSVAWSSSDSTVATVDQTGKVTAVGPGPATITATSQDGSNKTGASTITVAAAVVPVTSVTVAPATVALTVGDTTTLTATVAPSTATDKSVAWSSSDTAVATVDQSGLVTAVGPGPATITATSQDGSNKTGSADITVAAAVVPVTSVTVTPPTVALTVGDTTTLTATVAPATATNQSVSWSSSDSTVATVDSTGKVTAIGPGPATITATSQDGSNKTGSSTVTVTAPVNPASAANSTFTKTSTPAATTGGAGRLANGADAFTFTVTVRDTAGQPMSNQSAALSVSAPSAVKISTITDNHDGTYTFTATSTTAGNYQVTVSLGGTQIGAPAAINFLSATSLQTDVTAGQTVTAKATGFQPGEQVTVTANSTPLALGKFTASASGAVNVQFKVPADFAVGNHTVQFVGATSGKVIAAFHVVASPQPAPPGTPTITVTTGGVLAPSFPIAPLTLLCLAAVIGAILWRRNAVTSITR